MKHKSSSSDFDDSEAESDTDVKKAGDICYYCGNKIKLFNVFVLY